VVLQAPVGHAVHPIAGELENVVSLSIPFECSPRTVVAVSIELEDQTLGVPHHVNLDAGDDDVDMWHRQAVAAQEIEAQALQL